MPWGFAGDFDFGGEVVDHEFIVAGDEKGQNPSKFGAQSVERIAFILGVFHFEWYWKDVSYQVAFPQQPSGAMDFQIHDSRGTSIPWVQICELIRADLLRLGATEAKDLWESYRFGLFDGPNGFGDDFAILAASVKWEEYLSLNSRRDQLFRAVQSLARIVQRAAHDNIRFVSFGFDPASENFPRVEIPAVVDTGVVVREVLRDMESTLRDGRPLSGVDRAHTALLGHIEHILSQAGIPFAPDSQITFLFRELTQKHPAFSGNLALGSHINNAIGGLARVVNALGPARNRGSIAHPNGNLLDAPEAALFVDSANTLLGYIERRLAVARK